MDTRRFTLDTALTLVAAYLGLFVGLVDANAINLALPAVRDDLGGGIAGAQWTIDAYNVTFAALLLTSGSLGDRFGRRRLLGAGLAVFVVASLSCAVAPSLPVLLGARAVQGVGAAMMLPQGLAIAAAAFPDPIGPILGGVLTDTIGWRYIFWLNIPVGLLALLMTRRYLPESRDDDASHVDVRGQTMAVVGLAALTIVLVEGIMGNLLDREALVGGDGRYDPSRDGHDALSSPGHDIHYELTDGGRDFLTEVGIELPTSRRPLVRYCIDWTEQRHNLSGALGRAVLDRFLLADWVKRVPRGRAVTVTDEGRIALADAFGIDWSD
ncbi:MAG: MFS transporter [Mycobacterium sp.]